MCVQSSTLQNQPSFLQAKFGMSWLRVSWTQMRRLSHFAKLTSLFPNSRVVIVVVAVVVIFLENRELNIARVLEEKSVVSGWAYQSLNKWRDVMAIDFFQCFEKFIILY
jgi:hypothetical protein